MPEEYARFCREKGYQAISSFDTVSLKPPLVYAATLKNNRFGIVDVYGKEVIKNDYDMIVGIYSTNSVLTAYHDHFFLKKNDLWALSDQYGSLLTPFIYQAMYYEDYRPEGKFVSSGKWHPPVNKDSVFKAKLEGKYVYLNTKGETIPYTPGKNRPASQDGSGEDPGNFGIPQDIGKAERLNDHLFLITTTDKAKPLQGVYDLSLKKMILPAEFTYVALHQSGFLSANKEEGTYAYNLKGNLISKETVACYSEVGNEVTPVIIAHGKNGKSALFSKNVKPLTDFIYDEIKPSAPFIKGIIKNKNGEPEEDLMTLEGKKIKISTAYDRLVYRTNEYDRKAESFLFLMKKDKYAIVGSEGKPISDFIYDDIVPECFIDGRGPVISDSYFFSTESPNRFILFKKDGKTGIMDNRYRIMLNNDYDEIRKSQLPDYVYINKRTASGNRWGVYDIKRRKEIISPQFDRPITNSGSFFSVLRNGKYGLYSTEGKEILPPEYSREVRTNTLFRGLHSLCQQYDIPAAYVDSGGTVVLLDLKK